MSDQQSYQKLPPGWDCKYDQTTGNCYYINYITRMMQVEDPRYKQLQNEQCSMESIPLQPLQSSPYHVYPKNNLTAVHAFQSGSISSNQLCASPLVTRSFFGERNPQTASKISVMQTPRLSHGGRRQTIQETSFTSNKISTDLVVAKIQNMFPTVSENHIRLLLKKYYNREAVVISALQVEKNPITMPGPFVTPPAQRHVFHSSNEHNNYTNIHMLPISRQLESARIVSTMLDARAQHSRGIRDMERMCGTPPPSTYVSDDVWRSSPVTSHSPKMKLRYMKNIFPKAEETFLLDILANADNNVQKASENLLQLGYVKRNCTPVWKSKKLNQNEQTNEKDGLQTDLKDVAKSTVKKELSLIEKEEMKMRLQEIHASVSEHIILMALEAVNYDENKALKILQIMRSDADEQIQINAQIYDKQSDEVQQEQHHEDLKDNPLNGDAVDNSKQTRSIEIVDGANATEMPINLALKTLPKRKAFLFTKFRNAIKSATSSKSLYSSKSQLSSSLLSSSSSPSSTATKISSSSTNSCTIASTCVLSTASIAQKMQNINNDLHKTHISEKIRAGLSSSQTHCALSSSTNNSKLSTRKHCLSHSSTTSALDDATKNTIQPRQLITTKPKSTDMQKKKEQEFHSLWKHIVTMGHNAALAKGPNEGLLLADYVTWSGSNAQLKRGNQQELVAGPDSSILGEHIYIPRGHNATLCKGQKSGLAKGSIYAKKYTEKTSSNIKCN